MKEKKAREEKIDQDNLDVDQPIETVITEVLAEKTDLLCINSEDVESESNKEVESHSDDSSNSICSPPQALRIDPEREENISARRAALEARSYTDESVDSESVQDSECAAVMNSKEDKHQMDDESEEQESESKNSKMEEESSEGKSDDDMTDSSGNVSGLVLIGGDTSMEEEPIPEEALSDDEVPIKSKDKEP